jgi:hypothetical protein
MHIQPLSLKVWLQKIEILFLFLFFFFPGSVPPKESGLRLAIDKIRSLRFAGPDVVFDTTGNVFDKYLIESTLDFKAFTDEMHAMEKK